MIVEEISGRHAAHWIPALYREKVRSQRTRSFEMDIPERENAAEILHTLLGIELKIGKIRYGCPDLATARYLRVFARIGCRALAIPYDITRISPIADELEIAWYKTMLILDKEVIMFTPQSRRRRRSALVGRIREELVEIGAGDTMPDFKNSTSQRNS